MISLVFSPSFRDISNRYRLGCSDVQVLTLLRVASDGSYIYIFENRNLQVYHIETDTMRIYELAALDVENAGLFYWRNTLYIVGVTVKGYM